MSSVLLHKASICSALRRAVDCERQGASRRFIEFRGNEPAASALPLTGIATAIIVALLCAGVVIAMSGESAEAAVVLLKGDNTPLYGYLISDSGDRVRINLPMKNGEWQERNIPRDQILELLICVSPARLQSLNPAAPQEYCDYAEELAEKHQDPEARDTAIRLYVIAAHLAPEKMGRRAMLGAATLARSRDEELRFRSMAFLLDPAHDRTLLKPIALVEKKQAGATEQQKQGIVQAVRFLRRGEFTAAKKLANRPSAKEAFEWIKSYFTHDDYVTACDEKKVSPSLLRQLIAVELEFDATLEIEAGEPTKNDDDVPKKSSRWSQQMESGLRPTILELDLAQITEFNPDENVFRDGRWIRARN